MLSILTFGDILSLPLIDMQYLYNDLSKRCIVKNKKLFQNF